MNCHIDITLGHILTYDMTCNWERLRDSMHGEEGLESDNWCIWY